MKTETAKEGEQGGVIYQNAASMIKTTLESLPTTYEGIAQQAFASTDIVEDENGQGTKRRGSNTKDAEPVSKAARTTLNSSPQGTAGISAANTATAAVEDFETGPSGSLEYTSAVRSHCR